MNRVEVRPLRPEDDRSSFVSGDPDLDRFFRTYAGQNQFRHHIGTTYVAVMAGTIVGFATVSGATILIEDMPHMLRKRLPRYPLPVLRLARLAVDQETRGEGVARQLLKAVFFLAHEMAARTGCVGVVVDAKPQAVEYYRRYGFEELEMIEGCLGDRPAPVPMFLPLQSIPSGES
jgi:GNAT superfamily N-acetyltransferase